MLLGARSLLPSATSRQADSPPRLLLQTKKNTTTLAHMYVLSESVRLAPGRRLVASGYLKNDGVFPAMWLEGGQRRTG